MYPQLNPALLPQIRGFFVQNEVEAQILQAIPNALCVFVNKQNGEIYTKEYGPNGVPVYEKYKKEIVVPPAPIPQTETKIQNGELDELKKRIEALEKMMVEKPRSNGFNKKEKEND